MVMTALTKSIDAYCVWSFRLILTDAYCVTFSFTTNILIVNFGKNKDRCQKKGNGEGELVNDFVSV